MNLYSDSLLFIGSYSKNPTGGVAIGLVEYEKIFLAAHFVATANPKNGLAKTIGVFLELANQIYLWIPCFN